MADALVGVFADILQIDASKLNDTTSPVNQPKWDSLAAMHLIAAIENKFNVRFSTKEIMKMSSIGLARQTLQEKGINV